MKKIHILFVLSFLGLCFHSIGQTEGLPTKEAAFNKLKSNPKVYEKLKVDYLVSNPKQCKIEMVTTFSDGSTKTPKWQTYSTDKYRQTLFNWPDDRAIIRYTITTPKNSEGVSYVIPVVVNYTRFKNKVITPNWHYLWWTFEAPVKVTGKAYKKELMTITMSKLKEIGPNYEGLRVFYPKGLSKFYQINSVTESSKMDKRTEDSSREWMTRFYLVTGNILNTHDYVNIEDNREACEYYLAITFVRDKKAGAKWSFSEWKNYDCIFKNDGKALKTQYIYRDVKRYGFNEVYLNKEPVKLPMPFFKSQYADTLQNDLTNALKLIESDKIEEGKTLLKKHISDEEVIQKWVDFVAYFKEKKYKMREGGSVYAGYFSYDDRDKAYLKISISLKRESASNNKALLKEYKAAGMSKTELKKGGYSRESVKCEMKVEFEGEDLIPVFKEGPEHTEELPF